MQFLLRQETDESNPTIARPYGYQSTKGIVVLADREGDRTKFILELGNGGKYGWDSIIEYHYNGQKIEEFSTAGDRQWKFHPGTRSLGYTDPVQGRPEFFSDLSFTFSGKAHLEVRLPAGLSPADGQKPDGSEVFVKALKVMQYDITGSKLEETEPVWSANNALVSMDVLREVGRIPLLRFQRWADTWIGDDPEVAYQARADEEILWDRGETNGGVVMVPRFDAHCVFAQSIGYAAAFESVLFRSPGVMWQYANGGLKVLPNPDRDPVHIFQPSNVVRGGISFTPPDPSKLFNFFIFTYRDLDDLDAETGQRLWRKKSVFRDRPVLRDANHGGRITFGPYYLGLMRQSLAERIASYLVRTMSGWETPDDPLLTIFPLEYQIEGQMDASHVTKADYVQIQNHYMAGMQTALCRVKKEVIKPKKGERLFTVEVTARDLYRDTDHSEQDTLVRTFAVTSSSPLAGGVVDEAYSQTLAASGGTAPYTWALDSGSLPGGLSLSSDGVISGTPTTQESQTFTVEATDAESETATKELTITVSQFQITTTSLPDANEDLLYTQTLVAVGGVSPLTWDISAGSLPTGLSLSGAGVITGVPTTSGSSSFTVRVTDDDAKVDTQALSIDVASLTITTFALSGVNIGEDYNETVSASGGTAPYSWTVISGLLPSGFGLNAATGEISGTATGPTGFYFFTVQVEDNAGAFASRQLSIRIFRGEL
jgi:hypothetical protein